MKEKLTDLLSYSLLAWDDHNITISGVIGAVFVLISARVLLFFVKRITKRRIAHKSISEGKGYAYYQVAMYFIYTIAFLLLLDVLGFSITVILAGSTALLVGLGLGLQDTFKDWVAGFVLLVERSITAGDIVELDGIVGIVEEVGLRTTLIKTRDDIILVLPNQRLTSNYVINWTQNGQSTRFNIDVGVAYGSDTSRVRDLLLEAATDHHLVSDKPEPRVLFHDFGNSSLDFKLQFYCDELFRIERVKSDLRFLIDKKFRKNNITIPFPQRDLWIKNAEGLK